MIGHWNCLHFLHDLDIDKLKIFLTSDVWFFLHKCNQCKAQLIDEILRKFKKQITTKIVEINLMIMLILWTRRSTMYHRIRIHILWFKTYHSWLRGKCDPREGRVRWTTLEISKSRVPARASATARASWPSLWHHHITDDVISKIVMSACSLYDGLQTWKV